MTLPLPSPLPTPTNQPDLIAELDACLTESLKFSQNFAERMRLVRMQVLVAKLREHVAG